MVSADEPLHGKSTPDLQFLYTFGPQKIMELISIAVLDLPQLYQKPSGTDLVKALALLSLQPRTFGTTADVVKGPAVQPEGVTRYLTSIIASSLAWLDTDELREAIWDAASARLSERSGRTGKNPFTCVVLFR